jgi:hypothetical protein
VDQFLGFFVHHPLRIVGLASIFLAAWGVARATGNPRNALLIPTCFCFTFAAWEWFATARSPEANIRVDLLVIWPLLAILTLWALYRTFKRT